MKKNLVLSLVMLLGLAACQKESSNVNTPKAPNLNGTIMKPAVGQLPAVVIMNQVGPNTYQGYFHGSAIQITGAISYDQVKYPTVVDGIPVYTETMTTYDNTSVISVLNTGTEGNVFSTWVPILTGLPSPGFQADYDTYVSVWDSWSEGGMTYTTPLLSDYVQSSYSSANHAVTYTGKVIKVTTGSGVALTEINYPLPTASTTPPTINDLVAGFVVADPNNSQLTYYILGTKGNVTSAQHLPQGSGGLVATGSYTVTAGITHAWGTVIRTDGSTFSFNDTQDTR